MDTLNLEDTVMIGSYEIMQPTKSYFVDWVCGYPVQEQGFFFKTSSQPLQGAMCFPLPDDFNETRRISEDFLNEVRKYPSIEVYSLKHNRRFLDTKTGLVKEFSTLPEPSLKLIFDALTNNFSH